MYQTALTTLTQLKLDILTGEGFQFFFRRIYFRTNLFIVIYFRSLQSRHNPLLFMDVYLFPGTKLWVKILFRFISN